MKHKAKCDKNILRYYYKLHGEPLSMHWHFVTYDVSRSHGWPEV